MALKGKIETVSLAGVLQLLCNEKKTGILRVSSDGIEYQIYFLEGNILYAIQSFKAARLGRLLIEDGIISKPVIDKCLKKASAWKQSIGKVLVDEGYISFEVLEKYIYKQILEIFCHAFQWESGEFSYIDQEYNLRWLVVVRLNTLRLVVEASKFSDENKK